MNTDLNLEIIESFDLPKRINKPDWDDVEHIFTLPNGIELSCLVVCGNEPTDCDALEGLGGWIYLTSKEELEKYVSKKLASVIIQNRNQQIKVTPGYDGVYGVPIIGDKKIDKKEVIDIKDKQLVSFEGSLDEYLASQINAKKVA